MSIRGTSAAQDGRYFTQEKKLLAKMTFPSCFNQRVDMNKVQREVISQWVTERITQLLGFEDDIVVAMAINLLEPKIDEKLDPKQLQIALTGFLEKQAGTFTEELWQLLLSAQSNPTGIPSSILDKKKQEMQRIAEEKEQLKKVLEAKRTEVERQRRDGERRGEKEEKESVVKDEGRSFVGCREERRSRSLRRRRRSPSPRKRRRSRSLPRGRFARRGRSRSPSVKRRRIQRSLSRSPDRARERRFARRGRSSRRESSRRSCRSLSSSSSESRHRSLSSSRSRSSSHSPSPARRQKHSSASESESD